MSTEDTADQGRNRSVLMDNINTAMLAITVALLAWFGNKVTTTSEQVAAMKATMDSRLEILAQTVSSLESEADKLNAVVAKAYSKEDAHWDISQLKQTIDAQIKSLERRVGSIERQMEKN